MISILFLNSVDNSIEEPDPCLNGPIISIDNIRVSIEVKSTGEITVDETEGTESYISSVEGMNFQSSNFFESL